MTKNIFLVLYILIFIDCSLIAQNNTFNKVYSFEPYKTSIFNSVIVTDSCYYVSGIVADSIYPYRTGALFARIDLNGNVEVIKGLTDSVERYETWFQSLSIDENNHLVTHGYNYSKDTSTLFLIKYNTNGNIVDLNYFHVLPNSIQEIPSDMIMSGKDFVFAVSVENSHSNYKVDQYLLKLNQYGNVVYRVKGQDQVNRNILNRIANCPDNGYIIGGLGDNRDITNKNVINQTVLLKFDSLGNQVWSYYSPKNEDWFGVLGGIVVNNNNEIVFGTAKGFPFIINQNTEEYLWDWCITKMDMDKNTLWRTFFRPDTIRQMVQTRHLWNLIKLKELNGYVAVGQDYIYGNEWFGWIVKVSENGDSLWMRKYKMEGKNIIHLLRDIKEDENGNLIMVGEYQDILDSIGSQKAWLLKLDKYGCLVPGCQNVGIDDFAKKENWVKIVIYPNPANDFINFYTLFTTKSSPLFYRIIDAKGKVLINKSPLESEITYLYNTVGFTSGIYYLQILKNDIIIKSNKFLITK